MGEFLQRMVGRMVGRVLMGALGLGLWIGYSTLFGGGAATGPVLSELPDVVGGGGGGTLEIEIAVSQPSQLSASFEPHDEDADMIAAEVALDPGIHRFSVDIADDTYGYLEVGVPDATVGATLEWTVDLDGKPLTREEIALDEPLEEGYAFFVQLEFEEIAELRHYASR